MSVAPLAIVQARIRSTRLPGKVMLPLADGRPLLAWSVGAACAAFGKENVVVATTDDEANAPIVDWCDANDVQCFEWEGDENDVLGRFVACARAMRADPDAVIVRVTPDDPFKDPAAMRRVAAGERLPVEIGGEAFTLAMLDAAGRDGDGLVFHCHGAPLDADPREHITYALFGSVPPPPPTDGRVWTVDTRGDYERAVERSRTEIEARGPVIEFDALRGVQCICGARKKSMGGEFIDQCLCP